MLVTACEETLPASDSTSRPGTPPTAAAPRNNPGTSTISFPSRIGRYAVEQVLGQGAFGTVYLALDTELDRGVAIKVPRKFDRNVTATVPSSPS